MFNIDNIGYLRYRLKNVINLTSRYSYVLFLYLLDNRFRKSWSVDLADLKALLNCKADAYKQYYRFNDLILKKCHKEICEKTDLCFSYKPIKRGRSISTVEFTVETFAERVQSLADQSEDGVKQLTFADTYDEIPAENAIDYGGELADLLGETCFDEFSPEQIRVIQDLVLQYVGHDYIKCSDYLSHKLHITNALCKRKDTESRYKYIVRMINNDIKDPDSAL